MADQAMNRPTPHDLVLVERHGAVLQIVLNRADKLNAVNRALADRLDAALTLLEEDVDLHVGVLAGSHRAFCAGSDLASLGDYGTERGGEYGLIRRARSKPLIAAVEKMAFGGGMEIALACDLIVAAEDARFALPEVLRGLVPTCGGLFRGPRALPLNVARELVLTGDALAAPRAHALGLVNLLTPPGGSLAAAHAMAQRIAANGPLAVRTGLAALQAWVEREDATAWAATDHACSVIEASEDAQEGIRAFFEKRPAVWRNR